MRSKCLTLLLVLLLLCTACTVSVGQSEPPAQGEYAVYFISDDRSETGERRGSAESGALASELRALPEGVSVEEGLLELLMAGPKSEGLTSPFPEGISVRAWERTENRVSVDLSEGYNGLAGVELTLADSCIVLTLCQLDGVEEVYITVEGRRRPFRDRVYTVADFIEDNRYTPPPAEETPAESAENTVSSLPEEATD